MAVFFRICVGFDEIKTEDLILKRYHGNESVYNKSVDEFERLINYAFDDEQNERLHREWVSVLPDMIKHNMEYVTFNEYKERKNGANIDRRSNEEIVAELENLHGKKLVPDGVIS